jgi:TetR/AcrR family transcriptional repressor of lmrAB and yxaGH operons
MNLSHYVPASGYRAGGPITTVALETAANNDRLRQVCDAVYISWQTAFAEKLLENGFSQGQSERLASLIIAAIEGGILLSRTSRSPKPLENIADELLPLIRKTT